MHVYAVSNGGEVTQWHPAVILAINIRSELMTTFLLVCVKRKSSYWIGHDAVRMQYNSLNVLPMEYVLYATESV